MNAFYRTSKKNGSRAQAIVEFAIVLPILLMMLFGVLEVGRLIYVYAVVNNASRDAARYASAVGLDDSGLYNKYEYCAGIENAARHFAYFAPLTITIAYDKGPGLTPYDTCVSTDGTGADIVPVSAGDRVIVTVTTTYTPFIKLLPISGKTIQAVSARTILGDVNLTTGVSSIPSGGGSVPGGGTGPGGGGSGSTDTPTPTNTATPTDTPTSTPTQKGNKPTDVPSKTPTPTATDAGPLYTLTPIPTSTSTTAPIATSTPTNTPTPTPTFTSTPTPTAVTGCGNITVSSKGIEVPGTSGNKSMSMTFTNPNSYSVTVMNVRVTWNSSTGGPGNPGSSLALQSVSLAGTSWTVINSTGTVTTTPPSTVTIPGNATSTIIFTFNANYQHSSGNSIIINLSTLGCENSPIKSP